MYKKRLAARWAGAWCALLLLCAAPPAARAAKVLRVAYAGSMGTVMDRALGPAFARAEHVRYQGTGQGSYALARLIAAGQLPADVFICITPGPLAVLQRAGLVRAVTPIASTHMVVIYSPASRYASAFRQAARGALPWYDVLRRPGVRFGRSDPRVDPQGANVLLTLQLAERYYHQPGLRKAIAGPPSNPGQIFAEASLISRLEAGQLDATIGYLSAARSRGLPVIALPAQINLGDPAMDRDWYARAHLALSDGTEIHAQPLVFYAALLTHAADPALGRRFIAFLASRKGQEILQAYGYAGVGGTAAKPAPVDRDAALRPRG